MEQRAAHPLDIDLLSYALGEIDAALAPELDEHLGECLLCRIHLNRIRRGGLDVGSKVTPTLTYPQVAPSVLAIVNDQRPPVTVQPGQLWLAGSPLRILVWVEAVNHPAGLATVLAATLDVGAADHTSLIIDSRSLGREVAIFTSIPGSIPLDRLDAFVDDTDSVEDVVLLQASIEQSSDLTRPRLNKPLRVGTRISGASDERLEFRQLLADQLAELDPYNDDAESDAEALGDRSHFDPVVLMHNELAHDLRARRAGLCEVRHFDDELLVGAHARVLAVQPIATVHELDCVMLVVASAPSQSNFGFEPEDAYQLLLHSGADSLAVADPAEPYMTSMFERSGLRSAFETPRAVERQEPRALWESRPLVQAVLDYLQGDVFPIEPESGLDSVALQRTELDGFLRTHAVAAIDDLKQIRATKGKNRALKSLGPQDAVALEAAIATSATIHALLAQIEEITIQ